MENFFIGMQDISILHLIALRIMPSNLVTLSINSIRMSELIFSMIQSKLSEALRSICNFMLSSSNCISQSLRDTRFIRTWMSHIAIISSHLSRISFVNSSLLLLRYYKRQESKLKTALLYFSQSADSSKSIHNGRIGLSSIESYKYRSISSDYEKKSSSS